MKDSEILIMRTLIEQCDSQIRKAKKSKKRAEEDVDNDITTLFSTYEITHPEIVEEMKRKYRDKFIELKKNEYDKAIHKLEGVRTRIIEFYPQLS
jgi:hypothetical protein